MHEREEQDGLWFDKRTPEAVRKLLLAACRSGARIRVYYGDVDTGRCWGDEHDTIGTVGRSMGPVRIPLLLHSSRSMGGGGILDGAIVGLQTGPGNWAYRHPKLGLGEYVEDSPTRAGYVGEVRRDGEVCARFTKEGQAARWIKFMQGFRWAK